MHKFKKQLHVIQSPWKGGDVVANPTFQFFLCANFTCWLIRLSFYLQFVLILNHVSMKKNSKDFVMEKVGGGVGGGDNPPPPPAPLILRGKGWQQIHICIAKFDFLILYF